MKYWASIRRAYSLIGDSGGNDTEPTFVIETPPAPDPAGTFSLGDGNACCLGCFMYRPV